MAFNGDGQKFTGDDGFIQRATFGAEIAGDGATPFPAPGIYLVTAVAAASTLPAAALGGTSTSAGDILVLETGDSVTGAVGDDVVTLTPVDQCDISSWVMEFTKAEIDVSTLCDSVMKYRAGKADMNGTMNGIFNAGTSDSTTGNLREFLPIVKQDGDTSLDRFDVSATVFLGFFYTSYVAGIADKMYVVAPYQIYGNALGGEIGSAQSFSAPFKFGNLTYTSTISSNTTTIEPTFYRLGS